MKKYLIALAVFLSLSGCGGGGSSSGGGNLAGNYVGTANATFTGAGGTVTQAQPTVLVVANNGQVGFAVLGSTSGTTCTATPPIFLDGNSFSYTINYTCSYPDLGVCNIAETGSGSINGNTATAKANGTAQCPAGTLAITITFTGTKQLAKALDSQKGSGELEKSMQEALGI